MAALSDNEDDIVERYENQLSGDDEGNASDSDNEGRNDDEAEETKRRVDPATSRKVIRNPQLKLNTERLKGPNGIHKMEKYFAGFKFHGKGYEKEDLDRIMKRIEHWAYRLFPKIEYDEFLTRVETLGAKKDMQVFIKRYRMDMVRANDDDISREIIEEEEIEDDTGPIDEFDQLIAEQIQKQQQATMQQNNPTSDGAVFDQLIAEQIQKQQQATMQQNNPTSEEAFDQLLSHPPSQSSQPIKLSNSPPQMSDEVKARIERNKQQALERRMARLKEREEEAKRQKLEESEAVEPFQESINGHIKKEPEANNSTANENENTVTD